MIQKLNVEENSGANLFFTVSSPNFTAYKYSLYRKKIVAKKIIISPANA